MTTSKRRWLVPVDPGTDSGAIGVMDLDTGKFHAVTAMPKIKVKLPSKTKSGKSNKTTTHLDLHRICRFLDDKITPGDDVCLIIEDVGLLPPTFGVKASVSLMTAKMAFVAIAVSRGWKVVYVHAKEWQREFFNYAGRTKHDKQNSIRVCKQMFPSLAKGIDNMKKGQADVAEMALIGEYGRRRLR